MVLSIYASWQTCVHINIFWIFHFITALYFYIVTHYLFMLLGTHSKLELLTNILLNIYISFQLADRVFITSSPHLFNITVLKMRCVKGKCWRKKTFWFSHWQQTDLFIFIFFFFIFRQNRTNMLYFQIFVKSQFNAVLLSELYLEERTEELKVFPTLPRSSHKEGSSFL